MGAIDMILVNLARCDAILTVKETAQLSIVILCCLFGLFVVTPAVAYRRRRKPPVEEWSRHATKVNESLYELHKPEGVPTIQVLFFHGLPFGELSDAHLSTWLSGDGTCIWPKVWLAEEFPDAHILAVSYLEGLRKASAERFDMRVISENLIDDLIHSKIGQTPDCPVILVGHSFGGLVIKQLCWEAHNTLVTRRDKAEVQKFLDGLRGIFYYSTPHNGSADIGRARKVLRGPLFKYFTTLSTDCGRLNNDFSSLCASYPNCQIEGLGEMLPVETGIFQGVVLAPETSARDGVKFNVDSSADHFSVCRPVNTSSRRFHALTGLLHNICGNVKEEKAVAEMQSGNFQRLPKQLVNMDVLIEEVKRRLKESTTVGFVGMGGLGKTTLARAVFNELSPTYEYSCFVPNVKSIKGDDVDAAKKVVWEHLHHRGRKFEGQEDWSKLNGRELLLILDDINAHRDTTLLSDLVDHGQFSPRSRFIVTSRDGRLVNQLEDVNIYEVPLLDQESAEKLLLSHAFPKQAVVPPNLKLHIVALVSKCGGLPITLEVLGNHLKSKNDVKFWGQTLNALRKAEDILDPDKRLWAKLRISYDELLDVEKKMFLDSTTFFNSPWSLREAKAAWREAYGTPWSLREAKAAWREAYGTECETLHWEKLVDRCLVYAVKETERIRVHDQLLSLGQKIALEPSNYNGECRVWEAAAAWKLLQNKEEVGNEDIHALRVADKWDEASCSGEFQISTHSLHKLKKLQFLDVDGPIVTDGVEEDTLFPGKPVLLKYKGDLGIFDLSLQDRLAVLNLANVTVLPSSIGQLSALRIFICANAGVVPEEFGNLSKLEHLEFINCSFQSLPETFGKLYRLEYLKFRRCNELKVLPNTFSSLSNLKDLTFIGCGMLSALPDSFGHLSALNHLTFTGWCGSLSALPDSFGQLSALDHLQFVGCGSLSALPDSFGQLSALDHLEFVGCRRLSALPDSFGQLSALDHLVLESCHSLSALPDSFGNLSALKLLNIEECDELVALPDSFRNLEALEDLSLKNTQLDALPTTFGKLSMFRHLVLQDSGNILSLIPFNQLTQLQYLEIGGYHSWNRGCLLDMKKLPESLAELTALNHLVLDSVSVRSIPEFVKRMQSLQTLELRFLPYVKQLPAWLGDCGVAPLALSCKKFQVQDGCFSLTSEDSLYGVSEWLSKAMVVNAMKKVRESDYEGALADLDPVLDLTLLDDKARRFFLQERGIVRRLTKDLQGALQNLTAALEVPSDDTDHWRLGMYECWRQRGYVNFLLEDLVGAHDDAAKALNILYTIGSDSPEYVSGFNNETLTYMDFTLVGQSEVRKQINQVETVHSEMWEKVTESEFLGALAIWEDFDAKVLGGFYDRVCFLQERGILKQMGGNLHGGLEDLTAALEIANNHNLNLFRHRGYIKYLMGDHGGARSDAEKYMVMEPTAAHGPSSLGGLPVAFLEFRLKGSIGAEKSLMFGFHWKVMGKVNKEELLGALEIWSNFEVYANDYQGFFLQERGILKRMAGDLHGALEDLTAALEIESDDYECSKHRGYVKFLMGDEGGARRDAERCLAMEAVSDGFDCLGGLPVAFLEYRLEGRAVCEFISTHEKAKEKVKEKEFVRVLAIWDDLSPRVSTSDQLLFLQERGILKRLVGDLNGALEDLTAALEIEPDDYECFKHRGYVKFLLGDIDGARKDAERCLAHGFKEASDYSLGGFPVVFLEFAL